MLTLSQAKLELGIAGPDSGDDTELSRAIRQVIARIRQQTMRGIAWVCDHVENVENKAHLRVIGHGWRTGQTVKINGSGVTALDDVHVIRVVNQDTIEINVDTSLEGVEFTVHPRIAKDIIPKRQERIWIPEELTPCLEIVQLLDNDGNNDWTAVSADAWFANNVAGEKIVEVERIEGSFLVPIEVRRGQFGLRTRGAKETVRVIVYGGSDVPPQEVVLAGLSLVCDMYERAGRGKDEASFSFEDVRRQALTGQERQEHILSPTSVINSWVAR
jgi:hypothetical protein